MQWINFLWPYQRCQHTYFWSKMGVGKGIGENIKEQQWNEAVSCFIKKLKMRFNYLYWHCHKEAGTTIHVIQL